MFNRIKKNLLVIFCLISFCCGGVLAAQDDFEVNYDVVKGKDLAKMFSFSENRRDDYCYVIGSVRNPGSQDMLVAISSWHKRNKFFSTSGYKELGWIDGNNSAARFFLLPVGSRNGTLPQPADDFTFRIKVLLKK